MKKEEKKEGYIFLAIYVYIYNTFSFITLQGRLQQSEIFLNQFHIGRGYIRIIWWYSLNIKSWGREERGRKGKGEGGGKG